jgi:hypothetical protein
VPGNPNLRFINWHMACDMVPMSACIGGCLKYLFFDIPYDIFCCTVLLNESASRELSIEIGEL